jgi:pseudaminic acid synthase
MTIKLGDKIIGEGEPALIVAELSANHLQDFNIAVKTITAMKEAGADAVKLQTYTADTITINVDSDLFRIKQNTLWDGQTLYELYKSAYTPWEWQPKLKQVAESLGLLFFSSPFDSSSVDFLENLGVQLYKVASFEITDIPLIEYIAKKHKPLIISTGIATLGDIDEAINACKKAGNNDIILLKCTSEYPTPLEEVNLKSIQSIARAFNTIVGLSDHTRGVSVAIAAIVLGVAMIEKHFILDRNLGGPDAEFSLEPQEFKYMVDSIREVEKALGNGDYIYTESMKRSRAFSRSLFAVKDIKAGESISNENVRSIRPGHGLHPRYLKELFGKKARRDIPSGSPLSWYLIDL